MTKYDTGYTIRCCKCLKRKSCTAKRYKQYLVIYSVEDTDDIKNYVCRNCRRLYLNYRIKKGLNDFGFYKEFRDMLQSEVYKYIKRGLTDSNARQDFLKNIQSLMQREYIKDYEFVVVDNVLKGIIIKNIPFFRKHFIELSTTLTKKYLN